MMRFCEELFNLFKKIGFPLLLLLFSLSIIDAMIYYDSYFTQLGIKLAQVPMSWKDFFSNSIYWTPVSIFIIVLIKLLSKSSYQIALIILSLIIPNLFGYHMANLAKSSRIKVKISYTDRKETFDANLIGSFKKFILTKTDTSDRRYLQIIPTTKSPLINIEFIHEPLNLISP